MDFQEGVEDARAALFIAHPGHELRVHGWLEKARPVVLVLTDGSGSAGRPRLDATVRALEAVGARRGALFGRFTDRQLYCDILAGAMGSFRRVVDDLAEELTRERIEIVVGDAVEGFNPGHDLARLMLNAAVAQVGRPLRNYDFVLDAAPQLCPVPLRRGAIHLQLDEAAWRRKLEAARRNREMGPEVDRALAAYGPAAFRDEWLRPVEYGLSVRHLIGAQPFYESYGADRVKSRVYAETIRFEEHLEPIAAALMECLAVGAVR